jgi:exosortase
MKIALENAAVRNEARWILYTAWVTISLQLFLHPVVALVRLAFANDDVSHILLIPFIAAGVLYIERRRIFPHISYGPCSAVLFLALSGIVICWTLVLRARVTATSTLVPFTLALVLFWIAGFAFFFGKTTLAAGRFPLLLLLLMVPLPDYVMSRLIYVLQAGSAAVTAALFDLFGIPFLQEGFIFHLARVNIRLAEECSGIRSSMALLILALLVGHFTLTGLWKQVAFLACSLFMIVLKNGIRIATLTLLASYVDPGFLTGRLHRDGGVVFFLLTLLLLLPILSLLRCGESSQVAGKKEGDATTLPNL